MSAWHLWILPAFCLAVAIVELDQVHVGQWMISRPIVLGPVLGWVCGSPGLGLAGGALMELFCLDVLPVGAVMPVNGAVAAAAFVLLAAGPDAVPAPAAFPAALLAGSVFRRVDSAIRSYRMRLSRNAIEAADAGNPVRFGRVLLKSLGWHAGATASFVYAAVAGGGAALDWGWTAAPAFARRGLELAFIQAPWLGLAALLYSLRPRG